MPVCSNTYLSSDLYAPTMFPGHQRCVCPGCVHVTYRDLVLWQLFFLDFTRRHGGAEGWGDREQRPDCTWVNRCTEHAPPNTCASRAPSPHPCSSKRPEHSACGEGSRVPKTRPGGQVSSDTIKGEFPSGRESCSVTRVRGGGSPCAGIQSWSVLSQRCQSCSDLWVDRLLPSGRQSNAHESHHPKYMQSCPHRLLLQRRLTSLFEIAIHGVFL